MEEIFGTGSIGKLKEIIKNVTPRRVFIISGSRSYEICGAKNVLNSLLAGIEVKRHHDFEENPKFDDLMKGAGLIRDYNPDMVIAVGGGSVIDTAKLISVLPADTRLAEKIIKVKVCLPGKIAPLVVIPTTSGSGSEATHFAVCYLDKQKYSVADETLLPDYAILDPGLTYSMPPYQTAVSGADALCQAVESYWANSATDESRRYASEAIKLILNNLEIAVNNPDPAIRLAMSKGANLAGKAINISKTTAPHALSYGFTMYHGIHHGHAVSLTLGEFILFNSKKAFESSDEELNIRMAEIFALFGCKNAESTRSRFRQIMKAVGLQTRLSDMRISNLDICQLVEGVNSERLNNHPIAVSKEDIHRIITKIV